MPYIRKDNNTVTNKLVYVSGPPGSQGESGPQGPQGPVGSGSDFNSANITVSTNGTLGVGALDHPNLLKACVITLTSSAVRTIHGMLSDTTIGNMNPIKEIRNGNAPGGSDFILIHNSGSAASAKDRFNITEGSSYTIRPGESVQFGGYDYLAELWLKTADNALVDGELVSVLATRIGKKDGEVRQCSGVAAVGVGAGKFRWHSGDSTAEVTGMVLGSGSGRWKRVYARGSVSAEWFGAVGDWNGATGTDNHAAITAAIAWCDANKEHLRFGRGSFASGGVLSIQGMSNQQWTGCSSVGDTTNLCSIVYTGPGVSTRFIDARSTGAFRLRNIRIVAQPSSGSFTGKLIDLDGLEVSPSGLAEIDNVVTDIVGSTGIGISLLNNYNVRITKCLVARCDIGILGHEAGSFSNAIVLDDVAFALGTQTTCCIKNPGKSWIVRTCAFEGLVNGSAGGIIAEIAAYGLVVEGCWTGDTTGAVPGTWIQGSLFGATIVGNVFESYTNPNITSIKLANGSRAVKIYGNQFTSQLTAVEYDGPAINTVDQIGNAYENVTNIRLGSPASGRCDALSPPGYSIGTAYERFELLFARGEAGPQTIPNATTTLVSLTETVDRGGNLNGSQYTAPVTGWYRVTASVQLTQSSGVVQGYVGNASATVLIQPEQRGASSGVTRMGWIVSDLVFLTVGDAIGIRVHQTSGSSVDLNEARMTVEYVSS